MKTIFDYKKHSVLEYNDLLRELHCGSNPTINFTIPVQVSTRSNKGVTITFSENRWINTRDDGWESCNYDVLSGDVIYSRNYFSVDSRSGAESVGLDLVSYIRRPAQGITYKSVHLNGLNIFRYDKGQIRCDNKRIFYFSLEPFKKYKTYTLNTDCGLVYYEKQSYKNGTLDSSVRVKGDKDDYALSINRNKKTNNVEISLSKNFKRVSIIELSTKDCSIEHIFNKYTMFNIEMTCTPEEFEILENVRALLKRHLVNTYNHVKEKKQNTNIIWTALKAIEVMEDDEYQIQGR